jgi:hypothetical protein
MDFTFGIITSYDTEQYVDEIIESIHKLKIPKYEIIVVGGSKRRGHYWVEFRHDISIKPGWITKKKNIVTDLAEYDNVVYMHDYLSLDSDWYDGFLKFGNNWNVCMCKLIKKTGERYRDWTVCNGVISCDDPDLPHGTLNIPYTYNKTQYMYISGAFWVAKRAFMELVPLDENFCWGQGEDGDWSRRARKVWNYKMNTHSTVHLLKDK